MLNGYLKYHSILQLEMFCQISEKWNEITYVQAFMTLHNKNADAISKGNRFMSQKKKENLFVVDSRNLEDRTWKIRMSWLLKHNSVPMTPTALGERPPHSAEGAKGDPELVSPS